MSTTIKRVALVAVAALSLGVISVAPSQAVINADSLTLSAATATQSTAETATATSAVATVSFLGAEADSLTVTASLVSAPAGAVALPRLSLIETASAKQDGAFKNIGYIVEPNTGVKVEAVSGSAVTTSKFKVYLGSDSLTAPSVAGTYVVKLTPATVATSGVLQAATAQTLTITVTTAPTLDTVATSATIVLNKGETNSATSDDVVTASKTIPAANPTTTSVATIKVSLKNAAGSAVTAESYTATITGPGTLGSAAMGGAADNGATATGRAITVKNGDVVGVFPDGTSGVATVTISSKAGVVLGTKSLTFYGDVASAAATVVKSVIKAAGNQEAILVNLKDAAGTTVTTATTFYVTSSDATKISGSYTTTGSVSYDLKNGTLGAGYLIKLTGVAAGTANITVGTKSSATATTGVDAAAVSIRVGSATADSIKVTTDKSSYAPGEKATLTVAIYDATGLAVADGDYTGIFATGGIAATYSLTGDTTTAVDFSGAYAVEDGVYAYSLYMPVTEGDVKFSWTTGTGLATANDSVAGSLTVNVSSAATSAAIDAANEAAQAASDATDAALAAADAADAATTKAQEAVDAVATLSAQVSKLITALKAQITTLTNLVIKIQKKVKA